MPDSIATLKARLAAIARHHGPQSLPYQLAKAELDRSMRMAVVLDVAELYPDEFRYVARQLTSTKEVQDDANASE